VYVVLYRMQREGLIERDVTRQEAGRPARKYYRLTATGEATRHRGVAFLRRLVDQLTARS
jgi:DNA-binding PadR family transcriptional regulator